MADGLDACMDTDPFLKSAMLTYDHARLLEAERMLRKVALVNWTDHLKNKLLVAIKNVTRLAEDVADELSDLAEDRRVAAEEKKPDSDALLKLLVESFDSDDDRAAAVVQLARSVTSCDETADLVGDALLPWREGQ